MQELDQSPLSKMVAGQRGTVAEVGDEDAEMLRYFAELYGVPPGEQKQRIATLLTNLHRARVQAHLGRDVTAVEADPQPRVGLGAGRHVVALGRIQPLDVLADLLVEAAFRLVAEHLALDHLGHDVGDLEHVSALVVGLAKLCGVTPLWVLIEPDNVASRRVVERAGLELVDIIDTEPEAVALGLGPKVCRYATLRDAAPAAA